MQFNQILVLGYLLYVYLLQYKINRIQGIMLKSFDFFRRIQQQQQLTSTTGGIFTVLAVLVGGLLIFLSFSDLRSTKYYTFLAVRHDTSDYLPLRIDLLLPSMPCEAIQIECVDEMEYKETLVENRLVLTNIPKGSSVGQVYSKANMNEGVEALKAHALQGGQCRISGILDLPKTPGTLTIKPIAFNNALQGLGPTVSANTSMKYTIKQLQFGLANNTFDFPISHKSPSIQNYIKVLEGDVNTREYVQDFSNHSTPLIYYNSIKIIPVSIEVQQNEENQRKYRYSLRSSTQNTPGNLGHITFNFEIQPVHIVYKKSQNTLYQFLVQILAVVGGTVATIGIVNTLSHHLLTFK